jgi:hypothetical protein
VQQLLSAASASIGKSHKRVKTWMGRKSKLIYGVGQPGADCFNHSNQESTVVNENQFT